MIIIYKLSSEELTSVNKLKLNSGHEIVSQLRTINNKTSEKSDEGLSAVSIKKLVRGVLFSDLSKYSPNAKGNFICPVDKFEIIFSKVNDDYCDCPSDGSDEPGTNACQNGKFYCAYQSLSSSSKLALSYILFISIVGPIFLDNKLHFIYIMLCCLIHFSCYL